MASEGEIKEWIRCNEAGRHLLSYRPWSSDVGGGGWSLAQLMVAPDPVVQLNTTRQLTLHSPSIPHPSRPRRGGVDGATVKGTRSAEDIQQWIVQNRWS